MDSVGRVGAENGQPRGSKRSAASCTLHACVGTGCRFSFIKKRLLKGQKQSRKQWVASKHGVGELTHSNLEETQLPSKSDAAHVEKEVVL
ncbi:hypothetical protein CEXT_571151 [Caerostris extrusa]|uniref:Uncharacterized protein n=1 Tax=Caerostris extrusa TaxID=172846 RepID=A0AAV4RS66_CAEEX|nr:hypothetical protein CEXT_571151 [Caerostris extrusa]